MKLNAKYILAPTAAVLVLAGTLTTMSFAEGSGTDVVLHKLAYQNQATEVKNTGDVMEVSKFGSEARAWNNQTDGTVKFTAYKLDDKQLNTTKNAQAVADEVAQAIKDKKDVLPYGAKQTGADVAVDDHGLATFSGLADGTYVFVESTVSGIVTQGAKPLLVSLPLSNADGRSNKKQVNLYPKNKIKEAEVSFTKYLQKNNAKTPEVLKNDQMGFYLFKGEPGKGEKDPNSFQKLTNGTINVKGLKVGKYYFVEAKKTAEGEDDNFGVDGIIFDTDVTNNAANRLTFEYTADGKIVFPENSLLKAGEKVINYQGPNGGDHNPGVVKTSDRHDVAYDEDVNYTVDTVIPYNIAKYKKYELVDTPDAALITNMNSIKLEAIGSDGQKIKDVTFQASKTDNGFKVVPDLATIQGLPGGSKLRMTYAAKVDGTKAKSNTPMKNTVVLNFNNNVVTFHDSGENSVESYEAQLKKVDGGIFNSGLVKNPLKGAKFIVAKDGDKDTFLKITDGHYSWVEDKAQATEFDTNDQGLLTVKGLKNGKYRFVETQAPDGYNLNSNVESPFEIKDASVEGANTIEVTNNRKPDMPLTGTEVTALVMVGLAGAVAVVTFVKRRKKQNA